MKPIHHWILNKEGQPVPVDLYTWAKWFEKKDRIVKQEWIGSTWVSTVFLGLDHNWSPDGPPILWETMCFSNRKRLDNYMDRCSGNREQAEAMHERMILKVREIEGVNDEANKPI